MIKGNRATLVILLLTAPLALADERRTGIDEARQTPPTPIEKTGQAAGDTWKAAGDEAVDVADDVADSAVDAARQAGQDARDLGTAVKNLFKGD